MKTIFNKIRFYLNKKENSLLFLLLGFIGVITSCDDENNVEPLYGTPSADFIINGSVKSTSAQLPIENIQVIMRNDTIYTNANGDFTINNNSTPQDTVYTIKLNDIDGSTHGSFQNKEMTVIFSGNNFAGGDGNWYHGKVEKDIEVSLDETK